VEIRRALLLFAIVLGVAAIASSITRSPDGGDDQPTSARSGGASTLTGPGAAGPAQESPQPKTVEFGSGAKPPTRTVEVGQPATVLVDVETPGQVEIPSLGLTDTAEPLTPALFEVLVTAKGKHAILAQPAGSDSPPAKVGTLKVVPAS
jgi:hypothetical protein